jgi:hypothetical protein
MPGLVSRGRALKNGSSASREMIRQAVKRNRERFAEDFTFRLTREEAAAIADSRSQSVILKRGANIKYLPYVYGLNGAKR